MGEILISIFYLARPIMSAETSFRVVGLNFFEAITILFTLLLMVIALTNMVNGKKRELSGIETVMLIFIVWCTFITIMYYESANIKTYVKWILPLITYIVMKRTIKSKEQYIKLIYLLILGYVIPIVWNFIVIFQGEGLESVIFWTGLERYSGIYNNIHTNGHSMGFFVMLLTTYFVLMKGTSKNIISFKHAILFVMALLALYCLYKSQTRTVYVGLLAFFMIWLYRNNKKLLMLFSIVFVVTLLAFAPLLKTVFFDVLEAVEGKRDIEDAGSGRPYIWKHNLNIYKNLSIDRQIAGVGIGNTATHVGGTGSVSGTKDVVWNSHNDYLEALMETGAVGFLLQLTLYFLIYKRIKRISTKEAAVYEGMFLAIVLMNILSNSYISRFGLAQIFFMVMVYIELPSAAKDKIMKVNSKLKVTDNPRILRIKSNLPAK